MKHAKEQIKKAVMEALEEKEHPLALGLEGFGVHEDSFTSVADLVAEKLGAEG